MMISSQLIRVVSSVGRRSFGLLSFGWLTGRTDRHYDDHGPNR